MDAIVAESLTKSFEGATVLDNISFEVGEAEIFGFLGPNGAGKSTTMMILTTLIRPTSGRAFVAGHDVVKQPHRVRQNIGYVQHDVVADEYLTGRDNLVLHARLNHADPRSINRRIDEMLELVDLAGRQHDAVISYSAGMKKRLDIAAGMLHLPRVLFLDEPTVGLDIQTRRKIWEYVQKLHKEYGMSIFLSTHYMEEADTLCDRVGIIDNGIIRATDSPQSLRDALCPEIIHVAAGSIPEQFISRVRQIPDVYKAIIHDGRLDLHVANGTQVIPRIFSISPQYNLDIDSISLTRTTLDDVFVSYTGRNMDDIPASPGRIGPVDGTAPAAGAGTGASGATGGETA